MTWAGWTALISGYACLGIIIGGVLYQAALDRLPHVPDYPTEAERDDIRAHLPWGAVLCGVLWPLFVLGLLGYMACVFVRLMIGGR